MKEIPHSLREALRYDPSDGHFRWVRTGALAGSVHENGYRYIKPRRRTYAAHKLAWWFVKGEWPTAILDHRNRSPDDNRVENLRPCTVAQNLANRILPRASSGYIGVTRSPSGTFEAAVYRNGRKVYLGMFGRACLAAAVRDLVARQFYGEFAVLNFLEGGMADEIAVVVRDGESKPIEAVAPKAPLEAGAGVAPIIPRNVDEVGRVADAIIAAGMVPASFEDQDARVTKSKVMVAILKGLEVGFGPITAMSTICIIQNKPSIYGDGAVALCDRSGAIEWVKQRFEGTEGGDDWVAFYEIKRRGHEQPYVGKFSVKEAKRARLWANPRRQVWCDYPQRMLMARARAYALREGFADFLMGLSIAEEIQDVMPEPVKPSTAFLDDEPTKPKEIANDGQSKSQAD
jgi:hypothetical protein